MSHVCTIILIATDDLSSFTTQRFQSSSVKSIRIARRMIYNSDRVMHPPCVRLRGYYGSVYSGVIQWVLDDPSSVVMVRSVFSTLNAVMPGSGSGEIKSCIDRDLIQVCRAGIFMLVKRLLVWIPRCRGALLLSFIPVFSWVYTSVSVPCFVRICHLPCLLRHN